MKRLTCSIFIGLLIIACVKVIGCGDDEEGAGGENLSNTKDITAFSFTAATNPGILSTDVLASIVGTYISAVVPYSTDVTALVATFVTTGESVSVEGIDQESGITANDFTNPVVCTITAEDATTQEYIVTVGNGNSPTAQIDSPLDGALFMVEGSDIIGPYKTLTFEATATDLEDDDNSLLVEWFASTDGKLGEGRELTTRVHMTENCSQSINITLRVTDSHANVTEVIIQIVLYYVC